MSVTIKNTLALQGEVMQSIKDRLESLSAQGITASQEHSGELNFNGCASGYCQAWD